MQTTLDIDESLLRGAIQQARREGKPLDLFVEEALRTIVQIAPLQASEVSAEEAAEGLDADDPFFSALDEIRAQGRAPATHREIRFH